MASTNFSRRRWPTALILALAAIVIGALVGSFRTGSAAITVKPTNVNPPTVSGTAQVGSSLTATNGTWSGTSPFQFSYVWSRCDKDGKNCSPITGANDNTYAVQNADIGNTLIITVTATNSDGKDTQPSSPSALVTAAVVTGCPSGTGTIQIADVTPPARLLINAGTSAPGVITPGAHSIQLTFQVTACGGRPVQGALLYATAVPFNQFSIPPESQTDSNGMGTLVLNQRTGFPASRHQTQLTVFARARKSGENILGGISSRRLVAFRVSLG